MRLDERDLHGIVVRVHADVVHLEAARAVAQQDADLRAGVVGNGDVEVAVVVEVADDQPVRVAVAGVQRDRVRQRELAVAAGLEDGDRVAPLVRDGQLERAAVIEVAGRDTPGGNRPVERFCTSENSPVPSPWRMLTRFVPGLVTARSR